MPDSPSETSRRTGTSGELGPLYEKELLMLVLHRALEKGYDFALNTNIEGAGDFDDVVFTLKKDGGEERVYVQLKHKENNQFKISYSDLGEYTKKSNQFSLYKYFISYLKIEKNPIANSNYFIIYTNADFGCDKENQEGIRKLVTKKIDTDYFLFKSVDVTDKPALDIFSSMQNYNRPFYQFLLEKAEKGRVIAVLGEKFQGFFKERKGERNDEKREALKAVFSDEDALKSKIAAYLNNLLWAVDQLNVKELEKQIKSEIKQSSLKHGQGESDFIFDYVLREISHWRNRSKAIPLIEKNNYFKVAEESLNNLQVPYLYPTISYENRLSSMDLQCKTQDSLTVFLGSTYKVWHLHSETPLLSSTFIYQTLQATDYAGLDRHLFFKFSDLQEAHQQLLPGFKAPDRNLLIITCESPTVKKGYSELIDKIKAIMDAHAGNRKQVIVIASTKDEFALQLKGIFIESYQAEMKICLSALEFSSQVACLTEEKIRFQGRDDLISLSQLLGIGVKEGDSLTEVTIAPLDTVIDAPALAAFFEKSEIELGEKGGPLQYGWDENQMPRDLYRDRCFYPLAMKNTAIKNLLMEEPERLRDFIVFSGIGNEDLLNLLSISNEEEKQRFKKATFISLEEESAKVEFDKHKYECPVVGERGVHWLQVKEKRLYWLRSVGYVQRIRGAVLTADEYDKDKNAVPTLLNEADLVTLKTKERVVILADEPGMGKSTTLMRIGERLVKDKEWPYVWIMSIALNRYQAILGSEDVIGKIQSLSRYPVEDSRYDWACQEKSTILETVSRKKGVEIEWIVTLLSRLDDKLKDPLACRILVHQLERSGQVVFLLDGFDEVKSVRQSYVLEELLWFLKESTKATLWITTRRHAQSVLEDRFSVLAYYFKPLDESQQINFLQRFWAITLKLPEENLKAYAEEVIGHFEQSLHTVSTPEPFVSIPLCAKMLAEVFLDRVEIAYRDRKKALFQSEERLVVSDVYPQFIEKKYDIYLNEKITVVENLDTESQCAIKNAYTKAYGLVALKELFEQREIPTFISNKKEKFSLALLLRIGLVRGSEEQATFIHRTFAEYYAAKWLVDHKKHSEIKSFLRKQLFNKNYQVVRQFFDGFLVQHLPLHKAVLQGDISLCNHYYISENPECNMMDSLGRTALHFAAQEGHLEMIQLFLEADEVSLHPDHLGRTPLHYAARYGYAMIIERLLRRHIDIDLGDHIFRTPLHREVVIGDSLFNNPAYAHSTLVKWVNEEDKEGLSPLYYAADNQHWHAACVLLLHGASSRALTQENKKELLRFASRETHGAYCHDYHVFRPVVGLLSIQVPEAVHDYGDGYQYPRLLSYFFAYGHTQVIDILLESISDVVRRKKIVNQSDNGITPIRRVTGNYYIWNDTDHLKIIKYLFEQGVLHHGMEIDSEAAGIALLSAATRGHLNTFKYLVEQGKAPVNYWDAGHFTVIDRALIGNNQQVLLHYLWENYKGFTNDFFHRTPLHIAACSANVQAAYYLCRHGAEVNAKDGSGRTPLHYAAWAPNILISPVSHAVLVGHRLLVQYLIEEQKADFNSVDNSGKTALDLAIESQRWDSVGYLIKKGAELGRDRRSAGNFSAFVSVFFRNPATFDLNLMDSHGMPRLHKAIESHELQWARFLIRQGAEINKQDSGGNTALHWANDNLATELLLQQGARYNVLNKDQKTPLNLAQARSNKLFSNEKLSNEKIIWLLQLIDNLFCSQTLMQDLKEQLLREKSEVHKPGPYGRWHPDVYDLDNPMRLILNVKNRWDETLLHRAVNTQDQTAIQCLLQFDKEYFDFIERTSTDYLVDIMPLNINALDDQGNTPLHYAVRQGHVEIVTLFLEAGAIFNARNCQNKTPQALAQERGHSALVAELQSIEALFTAIKIGDKSLDRVQGEIKKIAVCARDDQGKTLLHWAAQQGQVEMIKRLLEEGADKNALDNQQETPLHQAATHNQEAAILYLLQRGVIFNLKNKQGKTPLDSLQYCYRSSSILSKVDQLFSDVQLNRPQYMIGILQNLDNYVDRLNAVMNACDEGKNTLLHWAAREHYCPIVRYLLKKGAVYDVKNKRKKTPENLTKDQEIISLLQLVEEWINNKEPLKFNVEEIENDPEKLMILKNARDCEGKTPLHSNTNYFRLKYLLEQEADLTVQDLQGKTPLQAAMERGDSDIVRLFSEKGSEMNRETKEKKTLSRRIMAGCRRNLVTTIFFRERVSDIPADADQLRDRALHY